MKVMAIIQLTFRESLAKKTFMAFFAISTLVCLLFIFALNLDIVNGAQSSISLFGNKAEELVDVREVITVIEGAVAVLLFTGGIFMSLFATSNLIPTLLRPGFIDLFISKPVSRIQILSGRILGSVSIVAFNIFYLILFSWIIMSVKTGVWNWGFLLAGIMIVLTFIILFSLMTFLGLLTGSGPFSLMITYLILFFSPLLIERNQIYALLTSKYYGYLVDGLYYFLPKTTELGNITQQLVRGITVSSWLPLWSSLLFAAFMIIISISIFLKKNF
jgi:ABC-type transport system involved in multi-copper enzyme maturation permease subunit